jgi:hypothetical protein
MPVTQPRARGLGQVILACAIAACGGCSEAVPPLASNVASVEVSPERVRLQVGDSVHLAAAALDAGGGQLTSASFVWRSRNAALATVTDAGFVRAVAVPTGATEDSTWVVAIASGADSVFRDSTRVVVTNGAAQGAPRMGMNLDMVNDWSTEWPFTNLMRSSRPWISQRQGAGWGQGGPLALTPERYVASLEPGQ